MQFLSTMLEAITLISIYSLIIKVAPSNNNSIVDKIIQNLSIENLTKGTLILATFLVFFRFFTQYVLYKYIFYVEADLGLRILEKNFNLPYQDAIKNRADKLKKIVFSSVPQMIHHGLLPLMNLAGNISNSISIVCILIFVGGESATKLLLSILIFYILFYYFLKKYTFILGKKRDFSDKIRHNLVEEYLRDYKQAFINNTINYYNKSIFKSTKAFNSQHLKIILAGQSPRYILEFLLYASGIVFIYQFNLYESNSWNFALYGTLIFASIRLIPALQQMFFNFTLIKFTENIVLESLQFMEGDDKVKNYIEIDRNWKRLELKNVEISCDNFGEKSINKINIIINRNEILGISGESGVGKTSLLDVIFGLRSLKSGSLIVDDIKELDLKNGILKWTEKLSYVQSVITLVEGDIYVNIAMSENINKRDREEIDKYLKYFRLDYLSNEMIKFSSNGEKQKIGLARALFQKTSIIVMDEPTSAMDAVSEEIAINALSEIKATRTIILVSHRQSPLEICDSVYNLIK